MYAMNLWHLQRVQKNQKGPTRQRWFFLKNMFRSRTYCSQQFCAKQGFKDGSVLKIVFQDIPVANKPLVSTCVGQGQCRLPLQSIPLLTLLWVFPFSWLLLLLQFVTLLLFLETNMEAIPHLHVLHPETWVVMHLLNCLCRTFLRMRWMHSEVVNVKTACNCHSLSLVPTELYIANQ